MPAQVSISLTPEIKHQLEKNVRSRKTSVRLLERSKIILLAAQGVPNYRISQDLGININDGATVLRIAE